MDPEIPVNVVDLGLIYNVDVSEKKHFWTFLERKSAENEENSRNPKIH